MWPTDNDTQPGTGKNARRMCLHHQTIQYFCVTGTKIEKGKNKRVKNKVFEAPRFLGQGFCPRKLQSRVAMGLGRSLAPGQLLPRVLSPGVGVQLYPQHISTAGAITCGQHRGALLGLAPGGCPNKGLLETPAHPIHVGERSHGQEFCVSPEKSEVVAGPAQLSGALGQGDG